MSKACTISSGRPTTSKRVVGAPPVGEGPHLLDRVAVGRVDGVGGAELQAGLAAAGGGVDGDDRGRPGDAGALDDRLADAAAADHGDARAGRDAGGVEHGAEPGGDAAAEQGELLVGAGRSRTGTTDASCDDHRLGEGAAPADRGGRAAVGQRRSAASPAPSGPSSQWLDMPLQAPPAACRRRATPTPAPGRRPRPGARRRPTASTDAAALVAGHDRQRQVRQALDDGEVGVADAAGGEAHEHVVGARSAGVGRSSTTRGSPTS